MSAVQKKAPGLDVARLRQDFPILHEAVRGKPLAYLDNAATTQKPRSVIEATQRYYEHDNANVHRAVHALAERATLAYEAARVEVQRFLNAASHEEVVFTRGTTEAINLVAQSFARPRLQKGDEVLITAMEHHSNIVPWQLVCEERGARLRVIPIDDAGDLVLDGLDELLTPRTKMVALVHVSNALGTVNPVAEIIARAKAVGAPVLLDGAQAAPHLGADVQALGCDFYAFSGHKIYGPTGVGVLWGKQAHLEAMPPWQGGGDMILEVTFEKTTYARPPARFEAGTPNVAGVIGLAEALRYVRGVGLAAIAAHEDALLRYATQELSKVRGLRLIGTAKRKAAVVSFVLDGVHAHDLGTIVDQDGVAVRSGHHCAQPVMDRYGVPATARASFALYNTPEEVDRLVAALEKARRLFGV